MILAMLVILGMVTFLDRINISVAGSSIMHDLGLSPSEWGYVQSAFILSYGLLQIPVGALGDSFGHRKILAIIVLWWSAFTAFTGMAGGLATLIMIRFLFGIGEAGSSPCSTGVISRWFEKGEVGKAQGYVWDEKAGEDRPVKEADHLMDSMRYFVKTKHIAVPRRQGTSFLL